VIKKIPFFNYPEMFLEHKSEYMLAIESVLSKGAFIMQSELTSFENELAEYLNVPYVIGVADGTIALKISLTLAGIGPGDEVILPSHTFIATASAVHQLGGVPVICDCRSDSMIDIELYAFFPRRQRQLCQFSSTGAPVIWMRLKASQLSIR
jgi:dTDP-4-amino-4,6-dideoxygalactose transaminase